MLGTLEIGVHIHAIVSVYQIPTEMEIFPQERENRVNNWRDNLTGVKLRGTKRCEF